MVSVKPKKQIKKEHVKKGKMKKVKTTELKHEIKKPAAPAPSITKTPNNPTDKIRRVKKSLFKMPSKALTEELTTACLVALEKLATHYVKKNAIFGDETQIFMQIRCIKIPNTRANLRFILPHSTVSTTGEVCLVTPDLKKGKKIDHEPTVEHWEDLLRGAGVKSVKTILPMRQLRVEYDQFELKRRLMTQHDFIMVDNRVFSHVSHILGKMFMKKPNMLIPVKINEKRDLKKDIDIGLRTVMLRISEGETSCILVGHTAMPQTHVKENILALVKQFKEKFPGGEENIRSLSIKLPLSLSLPLYLTLRPANTIVAPKIKKIKPKCSVMYEDELTTVPGSIVQVAPDGTVNLKKSNKIKHSIEDSDMNDKEEMENEDFSSDDDN